MRKALVTGGAGFIGSHLSRALIAEGWKVFIVDNLSTGFKENIPKESEFILLDLSRDDFTGSLPKEDFSALFHLAAQSSGEVSFDNPAYDLKTNCLSTLLLLGWCSQMKINRFIYTSSMSVYGEQELQPVKEDFIPRPKSFYGVGKLASEKYLDIYAKLGINSTALRLFNVYGPGQNMENLRQGMVSIYMAYLLKKEPIAVKGSPERYRDLVYIDDVIDAYLKCVDNPKSFSKTYNVGSGKRTFVRQLLDEEIKAFNYDPKEYPIKFLDPTPGDTFGIFSDITLIKKDIGWEPRFSVQKGLKAMVEWAREMK